MAAPIGNKFWLKRAKHGRDAIMADPVKLLEAACEYFEYTDGRRLTRTDWVGKDAMEVERKYAPPFTIQGFTVFLGAGEAWWRQFKESEVVKSNKEFSSVIAYIETTIYSHKYEGAATGLYNATLIARDLGLRDGVNVSTPPGESINVTMDIK
jgi:hypothetical protein